MKIKNIAILLTLSCAAPAWSADAPTGADSQQNIEEILNKFQEDKMAGESAVMAKSITLTASQAAKFWPMYEELQKEENKITDEQLAAVEDFQKNHKEGMDGADSIAYVTALLTRDQKINDLRVEYLAKLQEILPADLAARVIHVQRRLGIMAQVNLMKSIPLTPVAKSN